jgi:hypothetical protein
MERDWNQDVTISYESGQKCYETKDLVMLFVDLLDQGYTALGLGLIVDLVEGKLPESSD